MPSPKASLYFLSLIVNSAAPSMICIYVSKGEIFCPSSSPASSEDTVTFPVVFLIMVLLTTAFGTYSMIATMI